MQPFPAAPPGFPAPLTAFIGREREVDDVLDLVSRHRLVTITGAGGSGKTRLALEVAKRFTSGTARWLELAPLGRGELLAQHVAAQLQVLQRPGRSILDSIFDAVRPPIRLLVLDNCEHVIEEAAAFVSALLRQCGDIVVLNTSRESLGVDGERTWLLRGLSVESGFAGSTTGNCEAVQLFADRARSISRDFELTRANADSILRICSRLDGLPLAIELAAARMGVLSLEQIASRLDDVFGLLTQGSRSALPRQRTLRATVDWSYHLISPDERDLLQCLSTFAGSFSLDAVEQVCGNEAGSADRVLDLLAGLVARSLVRMHEENGSARYSLLEIIRQYAGELLAANPERLRTLKLRHAGYFATFAADNLPELERNHSRAAVARLSVEYDNLRAALHWCFGGGDRLMGLRLAGALWRYWGQTWQLSEAEHWWTLALAGTEPVGGRDWGQVLNGAGSFQYTCGRLDVGRELLGRAADVLGESGDLVHQSMALATMAHVLCTQQQWDAALEVAERAAKIARTLPESWPLCHAMSNGLGLVHRRLGRYEEADGCLEEALVRTRHGEPSPWGVAVVARASAELAVDRGRFQEAQGRTAMAIAAVLSILDPHLSTRVLLLSARVLQGLGLLAASAQAVGAIDTARATGMLLIPDDLKSHDELSATLRQSLGEDGYRASTSLGAAMTTEQALASAAESLGAAQPAQARSDPAMATGLATAPHDLKVRALGDIEVLAPDASLLLDGPGYLRCAELLIYLLVHPEGQTRDQIGVAFWPDASPVQVKNNFHVLLHKLRKALRRSDIVTASGGAYRINPGFSVWLDAVEFEREMSVALRELKSGRSTARIESALALYRGPFMDKVAGRDWSFELRERLQLLHASGLSALADVQMRNADLDAAIATLERLIQADNLHEESFRRLMTCLESNGRRDLALRHYKDLTRRLREQLDVEPEPATQALARRLSSAGSN